MSSEHAAARPLRHRFAWANPSKRAVPTSWSATAKLALVSFIIPTAVYLFMASRFGFLGPRINLDLLLVYVATVVIARRHPSLAAMFVVAGIALVLFIQVGVGLGAVYIDDPALIREYVQFVRFWPWRLISIWAGIAGLCCLLLYFVIRLIPIRQAKIAPALWLFALILALDLAGRTSAGFSLVGDNVATSSATRLAKLGRKWATSPGFSAADLPQPMLVSDVLQAPRTPNRLISVSVEALGLATDPRFNAAMFKPMREILQARFDVRIGHHLSKGGTLSGELRELCNKQTSGTPTHVDTIALSRECLPRLLSERGYQGLAIHGNSRFFYNRWDVYPALGFNKTLFYEDFVAGPNRPALCKTRAFNGVCDRTTFGSALAFVAGGPRRYAHVMTLDTHFPLGPTALGNNQCGRVAGLSREDLCLYANQMANLLAGFARQLLAARIPPDVVYIFGDHAPPYVVATDRSFFERGQVPFIVVRRR